jgi:shikimate 5-dehydrogenase
VLLGAGGAARALAFALRREGVEVAICGRTPSRARELARAVGARAIGEEEIAPTGYDILINATPVGLEDPDRLPLRPEAIGGRVVYDIVYGPRPTRLLREASRRGLETIDGREMLLEQALGQFLIWFDPSPDQLAEARMAMTAALGAAD